MAPVHHDWDVCVIDEIQMLANEQRGHSWTRALLGLSCRELHVCGGAEGIPLVRQLCEDTNDELIVHEYDRATPLECEAEALGTYANVKKGDCVVAFSRQDIYEIRQAIEKETDLKCCVVYGQLPPETRSAQANMFNEPDNEYDVLVASDAVGMGLNLNIRRVVFHTMRKTDGRKKALVPHSMVKQIAGRAGRRNSMWKEGLATCLHEGDMAHLAECLETPIEPLKSAALFPPTEHVQHFSEQLEEAARDELAKRQGGSRMRLAEVLDKFVSLAALDEDRRYFISRHDELNLVSNSIHDLENMDLATRFTFCTAPISARDQLGMYMLRKFAVAHDSGRPVALNVRLPRTIHADELGELCSKHNVIDLYVQREEDDADADAAPACLPILRPNTTTTLLLRHSTPTTTITTTHSPTSRPSYLWLSFHYPKTFVEREAALRMKNHVINLIDGLLLGPAADAPPPPARGGGGGRNGKGGGRNKEKKEASAKPADDKDGAAGSGSTGGGDRKPRRRRKKGNRDKLKAENREKGEGKSKSKSKATRQSARKTDRLEKASNDLEFGPPLRRTGP